MRYRPVSYLLPIIIGSPFHVIKISSSLYILTASLVNTDTLPSSAVLPTLISDILNSSNVSAYAAFFDSCGNGSLVKNFPLLAPPFAMPTRIFYCRSIGIPSLSRSSLLT